MNWFTNLFTSSSKVADIADKIVDKSMSGIDALIFTEEERSNMAITRMTVWLEVQKTLAEENSIRSITRRIVTILLLGLFAWLLIGSAVLFPYNREWSDFLLSLARELSNLVLIIAVFYFGWYGISGVVDAAKKK